jgi:hypothetical protein
MVPNYISSSIRLQSVVLAQIQCIEKNTYTQRERERLTFGLEPGEEAGAAANEIFKFSNLRSIRFRCPGMWDPPPTTVGTVLTLHNAKKTKNATCQIGDIPLCNPPPPLLNITMRI